MASAAAELAPRRTFVVPAWIALLCLVWGSTWYAIRICLESQPPLWSAALRFVVAGFALALLTPWLARREAAPPPPSWLWLVAGGTNFAGSYGVLYVAEQHVSSGIAAVLWGVFPLLMAASGVLVLGETLRLRQWLGFGVSFAGIVTVFAGQIDAHDPASAGAASGIGWPLLLLLSPLVSALGTTLIKKYGAHSSSIRLNRNGMLFGAALLCAAAAWREDFGELRFDARGVVALLYLAVCGTALTFGVYFWLLRRAPASQLSLITYVTPVLAMALAAAVGDGELDLLAWLGTGLVVTGIALVVQRRRR